jgi:hypothetical protein
MTAVPKGEGYYWLASYKGYSLEQLQLGNRDKTRESARAFVVIVSTVIQPNRTLKGYASSSPTDSDRLEAGAPQAVFRQGVSWL